MGIERRDNGQRQVIVKCEATHQVPITALSLKDIRKNIPVTNHPIGLGLRAIF